MLTIKRIKSLISSGENDRVEFKSTLRWNLKTGRSERVIEKSWLRTVVAFLNTDGGVLLIGVEDQSEIIGTNADQFENEDKYLLHINNLIREHIGLEHAGFIRFQLVPVDRKKCCSSNAGHLQRRFFLNSAKMRTFTFESVPETANCPLVKCWFM